MFTRYCLTVQDLSQHLAVFNSDGEFATASMSRNKIALWPQPVKSGGMMTEKKMNYSCGPDMESISRYEETMEGHHFGA